MDHGRRSDQGNRVPPRAAAHAGPAVDTPPDLPLSHVIGDPRSCQGFRVFWADQQEGSRVVRKELRCPQRARRAQRPPEEASLQKPLFPQAVSKQPEITGRAPRNALQVEEAVGARLDPKAYAGQGIQVAEARAACLQHLEEEVRGAQVAPSPIHSHPVCPGLRRQHVLQHRNHPEGGSREKPAGASQEGHLIQGAGLSQGMVHADEADRTGFIHRRSAPARQKNGRVDAGIGEGASASTLRDREDAAVAQEQVAQRRAEAGIEPGVGSDDAERASLSQEAEPQVKEVGIEIALPVEAELRGQQGLAGPGRFRLAPIVETLLAHVGWVAQDDIEAALGRREDLREAVIPGAAPGRGSRCLIGGRILPQTVACLARWRQSVSLLETRAQSIQGPGVWRVLAPGREGEEEKALPGNIQRARVQVDAKESGCSDVAPDGPRREGIGQPLLSQEVAALGRHETAQRGEEAR